MLKRFWQSVGKKVWLDEYKDSMIPRTTFRSPAPVSQPKYKKPLTPASDLSNNPYYKRDVRRNYPHTEVYTQADVGGLLLHMHTVKKISPPSVEVDRNAEQLEKEEAANVPEIFVKDVVEALEQLGKPIYSATNLPPVPGAPYRYKLSPEQHAEGPGEYYPSYRVY
ncbi:hypothetical protein IWW55_002902 [Coemansia sp. RSA 2706]|nr:hypothetical protein LPJ63_002007 [Coemansia sp. RSA 2711]KAJ1845071.1 hypothetical protein LPJ70_002666 [Coemansia sp. RSA 2708]KAJ2303485.1 hypothetical protein IWW55_002902 [Coemansia sp. RSA 2706]KAJ2309651.1 hypothetical protein IWW54_003621 [Coemansia sp. RSA 2705]KAJ2317077.1 hypothetical protein IWW52_003317 [Coemansia sp. RSA 2704]KAJ2325924.1 hypothetical protein IWW51_002542 [Coemansia sp. RSA 2702]KAJ2366996.1 hypothetical protein H4S01_002402 [Coemansia sp. RSA 2610]KAJ239236